MKTKVKKLETAGIRNLRWQAVWGQTKTKVGLAIVLIFVGVAIFAPALAPNDPLLVDVARKLEAPSSTYWLGTDQLGRCIASRLIWGSRNSLFYRGMVLG
ncbi:MAG: nickel ABC transporter permease subunit NikC, partial [Blautia sp.]